MSDLVTITVLTVPFIFVIAITWIQHNEKNKRRRLQTDLYAKALEKGQPLPSDLFTENKPKPLKPLYNGIILVGVGIGLSLMLFLMGVSSASTDPNESNSLI